MSVLRKKNPDMPETSDNEEDEDAVKLIAEKLSIEEQYANSLPEDKLAQMMKTIRLKRTFSMT